MRESSPSEMHVSWNSYPTNRVYYHNQALDVILGDAFDQNNLYIDGPAWLKEQRYDIEAKIDGDMLLPRGTANATNPASTAPAPRGSPGNPGRFGL